MYPFASPMMMGRTALNLSTWDPAYNANPIYTNGNRSARGVSDADVTIRGTQSRSSGKFCFEVTHSTSDGLSGIVNGSNPNNTYPGQNSNGVGYGYTRLFNKGNVNNGYPAVIAGDVIMVAVDFAAGSVAFYRDSAQLAATTIPTGPLYPAGDTNSAALTQTLNTGQAPFINAIPSGFSPWG